MRKTSVLVTLALLVFGSRPASADPVVLFSNLGPAGPFGPIGIPIMGPGFYSDGEGPEFSPGQLAASSFSLAGPARLTSIDLALGVGHPIGGPVVPLNVMLQLVRDEAGLPGTTVLATLAVRAVASYHENGSIVSATFTTQPLLSSGMYWFIAATADEQAHGAWVGNPFDTRSLPGAMRRVDTDWNRMWPAGAFRLFGERVPGDQPAPVPEPATMTMAAACLAGILARARRRRTLTRAT